VILTVAIISILVFPNVVVLSSMSKPSLLAILPFHISTAAWLATIYIQLLAPRRLDNAYLAITMSAVRFKVKKWLRLTTIEASRRSKQFVSAISAQVQVDVEENRFSWAAWIGSFPSFSLAPNSTRVHGSVFQVLWAVGIISVAESHHKRIKWKSVSRRLAQDVFRTIIDHIQRRGKELYDNYIELEPGAQQELQRYLDEGAYRTRTPFTVAHRSVNPQGTSDPTGTMNNPQRAPSNCITPPRFGGEIHRGRAVAHSATKISKRVKDSPRYISSIARRAAEMLSTFTKILLQISKTTDIFS
jgi:hypothetical protein